MNESRQVKLDSGSVLKVTPSPFAVSKALWQAVLKELKVLELNNSMEWMFAVKNFLCAGFSSPEIERCLWECMKRCTLDFGQGDLKIDQDTFEAPERRGDYVQICMEVVKDNVSPFMNSLFAQSKQLMAIVDVIQK